MMMMMMMYNSGVTLSQAVINVVRRVVCSFKTSKNDHVIEVQLYDDIDFVCPYYPEESSATSTPEYYTIYMVRIVGMLADVLRRCVQSSLNKLLTLTSDKLVVTLAPIIDRPLAARYRL